MNVPYLRTGFVVLFTLATTVPSPASAQVVERTDRWRFLDSLTTVSNDPRRVPIPPTPQGPEGTVVLQGGRVFDGTGGQARPATVVIERNRIAGVLPPDSREWPADALVIDVSGTTVMPGLIDLHTHLTYTDQGVPQAHAVSSADATLRGVERLRYYIESGITTVRDVGSQRDIPFRL